MFFLVGGNGCQSPSAICRSPAPTPVARVFHGHLKYGCGLATRPGGQGDACSSTVAAIVQPCMYKYTMRCYGRGWGNIAGLRQAHWSCFVKQVGPRGCLGVALSSAPQVAFTQHKHCIVQQQKPKQTVAPASRLLRWRLGRALCFLDGASWRPHRPCMLSTHAHIVRYKNHKPEGRRSLGTFASPTSRLQTRSRSLLNQLAGEAKCAQTHVTFRSMVLVRDNVGVHGLRGRRLASSRKRRAQARRHLGRLLAGVAMCRRAGSVGSPRARVRRALGVPRASRSRSSRRARPLSPSLCFVCIEGLPGHVVKCRGRRLPVTTGSLGAMTGAALATFVGLDAFLRDRVIPCIVASPCLREMSMPPTVFSLWTRHISATKADRRRTQRGGQGTGLQR